MKTIKTRYEPENIVKLWTVAERSGSAMPTALIQIAAYSGGRHQGIARLRISNIKTDPQTGLRYMHQRGKTEAGDRDIPIHSQIAGLIDRLVAETESEGYLIYTHADNQYGLRGTLLEKRFSILKTDLGFSETHDFHSIRRTVISMFESAGCPEPTTKDIVGHKKLGLIYGVFRDHTDERSGRMVGAGDRLPRLGMPLRIVAGCQGTTLNHGFGLVFSHVSSSSRRCAT